MRAGLLALPVDQQTGLPEIAELLGKDQRRAAELVTFLKRVTQQQDFRVGMDAEAAYAGFARLEKKYAVYDD